MRPHHKIREPRASMIYVINPCNLSLAVHAQMPQAAEAVEQQEAGGGSERCNHRHAQQLHTQLLPAGRGVKDTATDAERPAVLLQQLWVCQKAYPCGCMVKAAQLPAVVQRNSV